MSDIYEADLKQLNDLIALLKKAIADGSVPDLYVLDAGFTIENGNGYKVGTLTYADEQFRYTPTGYGDEVST